MFRVPLFRKSPFECMAAACLALFLALLARSGHAQRSPIAELPADLPAAMVAPDKALHAGGSAAMTIALYGGAAPFTDTTWIRSLVAGGVVAFAGVAKEGFDIVRGGQADALDLAADAIGIAVGLAVMLTLEATFDWLKADQTATPNTQEDLAPNPRRVMLE